MRFSEDKLYYLILLPISEFRTICWVLVGRTNPPRPSHAHRYHRRCQCFLQFWWVIQCCYTACIFISLLSICIPPQSRKPVTSGDIASQSRPWYIYDSQPQPSCPAVLSTILSLTDGSQDSLPDFRLPLTDKTTRLLITCTSDHTPTQTRAYTKTQFANTSPRLPHLRKKHFNHRRFTPSGIPRTGPWWYRSWLQC